jgi:protein-S-isoprenylcysteine O-methyltransferase Ste14
MDFGPQPRSATHFGINLCALIVGLATVSSLVHRMQGDLEPVAIVLLTTAAVGLVIAAGELWWRRGGLAPDAGLAARAIRTLDVRRVLTRLLGLAVTLGCIALAYWIFPEYHGDFYAPFWRFLRLLLPFAAPFAVIYFLWSDTRLVEPREAYWRIGRCALGRFADRPSRSELRAHALGWLVKAFFLPLMVGYTCDQVRELDRVFAAIAASGFVANSWHLIFSLAYMSDLLFCVVGYVLTLRLFASQIRSTDPTVSGWLVALLCYQPFYSVIGAYYFRYDESTDWARFFYPAAPHVGDVWGVCILVLVCVYGLATVAFGLRFSNLTHRGIITNGPYRYTKHPAYLSKNLSWWLISVPFLNSMGFGAALRHCIMLALLNGVYFLRAKTEERHLSQDPAYVAYREWIARHGMFARARRRLARNRS